jgi:SAM-dependent methyltransferase
MSDDRLISLAACPHCGTDFSSVPDASRVGACPRCTLGWKLSSNCLEWQASFSAPIQPAVKRIFVKRLLTAIRSYLNPISSPYSPLKQITRIRKETYYHRTINDAILAREWAGHYLNGLNLPEGAAVFDHGCGRGRIVGMLGQCGYKVFGQEIYHDAWWQKMPKTSFQHVPLGFSRLPWRDRSFHLVTDVEVISHLPPDELQTYAAEVMRVLHPGGYWLILEGNSTGWGARLSRQHYGRLHPVESVRQLCIDVGFNIIDMAYEGFYAPVFPNMVNFIRKQCAPWPLDISDFDSAIARLTPPTRRALWLLRIQRPSR